MDVILLVTDDEGRRGRLVDPLLELGWYVESVFPGERHHGTLWRDRTVPCEPFGKQNYDVFEALHKRRKTPWRRETKNSC